MQKTFDLLIVKESAYRELTVFCEGLPRLESAIIQYIKYHVNPETNKIKIKISGDPPNPRTSCKNFISPPTKISKSKCFLQLQYLLFRIMCLFSEKWVCKQVLNDHNLPGSKVSRISNFVVLSFSVITDDLTLSSKDQNVFCIVSCKEDYDHSKLACIPIFQKINTLCEKASIEVEGICYEQLN
jgi:hypothetical protein